MDAVEECHIVMTLRQYLSSASDKQKNSNFNELGAMLLFDVTRQMRYQ